MASLRSLAELVIFITGTVIIAIQFVLLCNSYVTGEEQKQIHAIREIICIGDSITHGSGATDMTASTYPDGKRTPKTIIYIYIYI